jgi:hypothetical protein
MGKHRATRNRSSRAARRLCAFGQRKPRPLPDGAVDQVMMCDHIKVMLWFRAVRPIPVRLWVRRLSAAMLAQAMRIFDEAGLRYVRGFSRLDGIVTRPCRKPAVMSGSAG